MSTSDHTILRSDFKSGQSRLWLDEPPQTYLRNLVRRFCATEDLSTYDPYDIWNTPIGFFVKNLYNSQPLIGVFPSALIALFDNCINNKTRRFYNQFEYPIVRALAALSLFKLYHRDPDLQLLKYAKEHVRWLVANNSKDYHGLCWGLGVRNAVSKGLIYDSFTPYSTMTPYALEALIEAERLGGGLDDYRGAIRSVLAFFEKDLQVMEEDQEVLATSYTPLRDRIVVNAVAYTMYCYALLLSYVPSWDRLRIETKIRKLYAYIRRHQSSDGSWMYSPHGRSFIDCFHSCIVLKNVVKTDRIIGLEESQELVASGYEYLKTAFLDNKHFLFRRFSIRNKPGLTRFDLYDNAEILNLSLLLGDIELFQKLLMSTIRHFCRGPDIYSQIDFLGILRNRNTLRWAVMPFLYAVSQC